MKHLLLTTIAAVVLVGCGEAQQSVPQADQKESAPRVKQQSKPLSEADQLLFDPLLLPLPQNDYEISNAF